MTCIKPNVFLMKENYDCDIDSTASHYTNEESKPFAVTLAEREHLEEHLVDELTHY